MYPMSMDRYEFPHVKRDHFSQQETLEWGSCLLIVDLFNPINKSTDLYYLFL